ncbi:MAG: TadE family protein [Pseudomonadota bacterium]
MRRFLSTVGRSEDGTATIEFVFLFPIFMFLFTVGFEAGLYMVRNVLLERGVNIAVRDVRLGNDKVPDFDALRANICANAGPVPDCLDRLQIEMQTIPIAPGGVATLQSAARCVDRQSTDSPLIGTIYDVGAENSMMIVRACLLQQPIFPSTAIGVGLGVDTEGNYAIVATTAFVNEPGNRNFAPPPAGPGT